MTELFYSNNPNFKHDCDQCKLIRAIQKNNEPLVDIYENCNGGYLLRFSDEPNDYSTPDIEQLAIGYTQFRKGI